MSEAATRAQRYLACISDPSRFRLVVALSDGERCVTDLAQAIGLSQSCTTRHVQALRREGIVESDRVGKRVMIRLALDGGELNPALRWALGSAAVEATGVRPPGVRRTARPQSGGAAAETRGRAVGGRRLGERRGPGRDGDPGEARAALPAAHELGWRGDEAGATLPDAAGRGVPDLPASDVEQPETREAPAPRANDLDDFLL